MNFKRKYDMRVFVSFVMAALFIAPLLADESTVGRDDPIAPPPKRSDKMI